MKLLIVDDQSTVVQGLLHCTNWAAMGFTVVDTALNAVDAKASLLRQEAEVMLCDIEMPMESGLDLLDWLRQRGMTTRCIFLTAHAEFRYAQEALRLGGFDYIMQPAPYEQVADAVSRALENVKEERAALEADYITRQLNYLQSACAQYIHCEAAFYPEGPQPFEQAPGIYQELLQQRSENVALKSGVLLGRPAEKVPEVFRIPQIGAWQKLLQTGCAQAMEQEACQLLDKLTVNNQLNSQTLRYFYQDFMQMLFSFPEKKRQGDMFREPEALELYRNGMKTVPDMKALVHYVASVWDNETEESSQSTVEIIMAYIAEHLENELRREELAEAVHLNPDYMARLFKKETGLNLKDYIIQQKMQEAQSLLCTTNLPISLIAAKVGYTNFGHFSTSYKKFYHKTPQEERSAAL